MRRLTVIGLALVATVAVVGMGCWLFGSKEDGLPLEVGGMLPGIELRPIEDMEGTGVDLPGPAGRPVLINAFASWCIPCRDEHPLLIEIAEAGEVMLIGVNVGDLPESATAFLAEMGNPYDMVGADPNREVFLKLGLVGMPQTVVAGADGRVLLSHPGPINRRFVDEVLPSLVSTGALPE